MIYNGMIYVVVYPYQITSQITPGAPKISVVESLLHTEMLESNWASAIVNYFLNHYEEALNKENLFQTRPVRLFLINILSSTGWKR